MVQLKDYYTILELSPSASPDDVKKAYRRLAHLYHPDKKGSDPYAAALFAEIKEAYEVLSNPARKSFYLQQRWYAQSAGRKTTAKIITPETVLKQMLELNQYVHQLDIYRMDKEWLANHIGELLPDDTIQKLNAFDDPDTTRQIILLALDSARPLPYPLAARTATVLKKLCINDGSLTSDINTFVHNARRAAYWEKRKIWIVLGVAVLLSLLILFL